MTKFKRTVAVLTLAGASVLAWEGGTALIENVQFARELSRAKVPFVFRMYTAGHTQSLWTQQAAGWLTLLLSHLAPAR